MGIQERKQREREQRISQIIDAAESIFIKRGMDKATMDEIAAACELSKATLYLYFSRKEELIAALALRGVESLNSYFETAVSRYSSASDRTRAMGRAYLDFYLERPENYLIINHQPPSGDIENMHEIHAVLSNSEWFQKVLVAERNLWMNCFKVLEEGVAKGEFHPHVNPQEVMAMLWAASNGIFQLMEHIRVHKRFMEAIPDTFPFKGIDPKEIYIKTWEYTLDSIVVRAEKPEDKRGIWNTPITAASQSKEVSL